MATQIKIYPFNFFDQATSISGSPSEDTGYPAKRLYDSSKAFQWKYTGSGNMILDGTATSVLLTDFICEDHNFSGGTIYIDKYVDPDWVNVHTISQSDNDQIVESFSESSSARWRITVSGTTNPQATEWYLTKGYAFDILTEPSPSMQEIARVEWFETYGGSERSIKYGEPRRTYEYELYLTQSELASFNTAMDYLDGYLKPFYFKDHLGNYVIVRLIDIPRIDYEQTAGGYFARIDLSLIEVL